MFFYLLTELDENYDVTEDEIQFSLPGSPVDHNDILQLENLDYVGYRYFEERNETFYVIKKNKENA